MNKQDPTERAQTIMKSIYKEKKSNNKMNNNESNNINYKKQNIIKTMSYKINKKPIMKDTTSSTPKYIELQEESSCISKLSNPTTPNIIPNKVDEFLKNFRAVHQQESESVSSLDISTSDNEDKHQRLQQCKDISSEIKIPNHRTKKQYSYKSMSSKQLTSSNAPTQINIEESHPLLQQVNLRRTISHNYKEDSSRHSTISNLHKHKQKEEDSSWSDERTNNSEKNKQTKTNKKNKFTHQLKTRT